MKNSARIYTLQTESFSMDYAVFGEGNESLVILPGISLHSVMLSAEAVAAAYGCFAKDYTVYLFERKNGINAPYSVSEMADDTAAAMKKLGLNGVCLFGVSQGGMTAQLIAARYPELVKKAVFGSTMLKSSEYSMNNFRSLEELALSGDVEGLNRRFMNEIYSPEYIRKYAAAFEPFINDGTKEELDRFYYLLRACEDFDSSGEAGNITCPVLVIGSAADKILSAEASPTLAEAIGAKLYIYPGYGHAVYDEAPDYKQRLADFFS